MKMKKILIIIAIAALSLFCLAGCDDDDDDNNMAVPNTAQTVLGSDGAGSSNVGNGNAGNGNAGNYSTHHDEPEPHHDHGTQTDIGQDKVIEIALGKVPGATVSDVTEIEREYENGIIEYEGEIWYQGYEYEFEIDGSTGNILKWEIDR